MSFPFGFIMALARGYDNQYHPKANDKGTTKEVLGRLVHLSAYASELKVWGSRSRLYEV